MYYVSWHGLDWFGFDVGWFVIWGCISTFTPTSFTLYLLYITILIDKHICGIGYLFKVFIYFSLIFLVYSWFILTYSFLRLIYFDSRWFCALLFYTWHFVDLWCIRSMFNLFIIMVCKFSVCMSLPLFVFQLTFVSDIGCNFAHNISEGTRTKILLFIEFPFLNILNYVLWGGANGGNLVSVILVSHVDVLLSHIEYTLSLSIAHFAEYSLH